MHYVPFSRKQKTAALWWCAPSARGYDAVICDGAIRSGKTLSMTIGFVLWSMTGFNGGVFAMCGKTIASLRRNVTNLLPQWIEGLFQVEEYRADNCLVISSGDRSNTYYLFGGENEASAAHIQGMTLSGALLDEAALMPRSFVEQAAARCSVEGSRLFFSCNPETPGHWFYREWIQKAEQKNALYLHFTLRDNASLSQSVLARYERMYSGVFYRRYVLGEWTAAEGLVYPFAREDIVSDMLPEGPLDYYISVDYGTRNPCSMGLWAVGTQTAQTAGTQTAGTHYALRVREIYHDSRKSGKQKTDEEYCDLLETLAGGLPIRAVVADPSALSFFTALRRRGRFPVRRADNDVVNGIRTVYALLQSGQLKISPDCKNLLREMENYRWAEDSAQDHPVKEQDHAMDEMRYFAMTILMHL